MSARTTLADVWPLVPGLFLQGEQPPERQIPPLARIDVSIRPLSKELWEKIGEPK